MLSSLSREAIDTISYRVFMPVIVILSIAILISTFSAYISLSSFY